MTFQQVRKPTPQNLALKEHYSPKKAENLPLRYKYSFYCLLTKVLRNVSLVRKIMMLYFLLFSVLYVFA